MQAKCGMLAQLRKLHESGPSTTLLLTNDNKEFLGEWVPSPEPVAKAKCGLLRPARFGTKCTIGSLNP